MSRKLVERQAPESRLLVLDDAGLVPEVRAEVEWLARADGALSLVCRVAPGEEDRCAFVADGDFAVVATQMRPGLPRGRAAAVARRTARGSSR
ncbi:MAG: hypothetical protein M3237_21025 [Actinomycetota bacterium]|nr:hypothetical protein [Actinomycetota bacterium]